MSALFSIENVRDVSARQQARKTAPVAELRGAGEAGIGDWRRMTKAMDASLRREMRKLGDKPTRRQVSLAARRARTQFNRNFPKARQEKIFNAQYAKTHKAALALASKDLGLGKRALAAAVDPSRLAVGWVGAQRRLLAKVIGQTARDYRRTANAAGSKSERAAAFKQRASVLESRADLIGSQENHQAMSRSTKAIHRGAGVARYEWGLTSSANPDPDHLDRVGQVFEWASPPEDGHPGQRIGCLCTALPVVESLDQ